MALTKIPASLLDTSGNISLADNEELRIGNSNDLLIYHDGNHSRIKDAGAGNLTLNATNLVVNNSADSANMLIAVDGGAVTLYHNGSTKLATSSAGATVTGTLTVTGDLDITGDINSSSVNDLDVVDKTITLGKGQTEANSGGSGIIIDGSSASMLWDESNGEFDFNNPLSIVNSIGGDTVLNLTGSYGSGNSVALLGFARSGGAVSGDIKYVDATTDIEMGTGTAHAFSLKTSGSRRLTIESGGDVGIGTTSPNFASGGGLEIERAGTATLRMQNTNSKSVELTQNEHFKIEAMNSNQHILLMPTGKVGIGTNSPSQILSLEASDTTVRFMEAKNSAGSLLVGVNGSGNAFVSGQTSGKPLIFETNNTERMRIDSNGNVGIGRTPESDIYSLSSISLGNGSMIYASKSGNEPNIDFLDNAFLNSSGVFEYQRSGKSTKVEQYNGTWTFANAPSGTAGQTATFTERMRIDANGQVTLYGTIGSNASTAYASMGGRLMFDNDYSDTQRGPNKIVTQNDGAWIAGLGISNNSADFYSGGKFTFLDSGGANSYTTRMIIDETGDIRFGHTGAYIATDEVHTFYNGQRGRNLSIATAGNSSFYGIDMWNQVGGSCNQILFRGGGSGATTGSITSTGNNATQYNTSSDYRLKENVDYDWDATTRLKQLKPCRFNWIDDDTNTLEDGFLAHEVSSIVPNAVTGEKDAVYTEEEAADEMHIDAGDIKRQQLDNSKLIPLLVKTIQELEARIATLEG